jgi:hypothetical protein
MNCKKAESLVTEFIDNTLSARETWELDKHFAECNACTRLLNETRRTVALMAESPRFEVSDDFMANIQTRIAQVEQQPPKRAWGANLQELFRPRMRPLWGAVGAACLLTAVVVMQRMPDATGPGAAAAIPTAARLVQSARTQSIALSASDPFGDTAAATMAASATTNVGSSGASESTGATESSSGSIY